MAKKKAIISETGEFPASYNVLQEGDDGIWLKVFGPVSYTHLRAHETG